MSFSFISIAHAASLGDALGNVNKAGVTAGTTGVADLGSFTGTIISLALSLVGLLFLVFTFYAGYLWMTARGAEDQIERAQKIITNTIIGLIITVGAYAITVLVTSRFSSSGSSVAPEQNSIGCCSITYTDSGIPPEVQQLDKAHCDAFQATPGVSIASWAGDISLCPAP